MMKLYRFMRRQSGGKPFIFWSHDKKKAGYDGHLRAQYASGLDRDTFEALPAGNVQEIDVPVASASALAKWLNEQREEVDHGKN